MAEQVFKDPYLFDFLGTANPRREREVEQGLVEHVQRFMLRPRPYPPTSAQSAAVAVFLSRG